MSYVPVTAQQVVAWEQGGAQPPMSELETLAEIYECPVGFFFLRTPPPERLALDLRGLAPLKHGKLSPESRRTLRRFLFLAEWAASIIDALGVHWQVRIGSAELTEPLEVVAQRERSRLGFTPAVREEWADARQAFDWWRIKLEALGVFVFVLKLPSGEVRGASVWGSSMPPAILVNHEDVEASTGRLFTLFHEYAHLLLRQSGFVCDFRGGREDSYLEPFANKFAARMLVLEEEFEERLRTLELHVPRPSWGDSLLDRIREPFRVSRDVIAILLEDKEFASRGFYSEKRTHWEQRKPGGRGGPSHLRPRRQERQLQRIGFSLARLLSSPKASDVLSKIELAEVLDDKVENIPGFLSWLQREREKAES